jgi:hypothetical protein
MRKIEATLETIGQVAFGKDENPKKPRGHG